MPDLLIPLTIHHVTWAQVGKVSEPGRYLFKFGWLTITAADIAIWQRHPEAAFTLLISPSSDDTEAFHLGAFDIDPDAGSR
jgi:response regulator RpfG family c-di-GMP phosphodiesterase